MSLQELPTVVCENLHLAVTPLTAEGVALASLHGRSGPLR
jgi:hypothetical protein